MENGRRSRLARVAADRWQHALVWLVLGAFSFLQRPGETTFDTKLDLAVSPGAFLERAIHAWNPMTAMGEVQNQAYGYLFPHGLFFWLGDVLGAPGWVVQRLWSAVLLIAAYEGARRLFAAIDHERARAWLPLVAGLAYALAPRMLSLSGVLTGEVHPTAVLPWVVLPLVLALQGRLSPLHGAAWSGVAVLFMGAVNATEVLLSLLLPGLVVLCGVRSEAGRKLLLWWPVCVVMATSWWLSGLLVQGQYAPPFLDYIETAATTTQPLGWSNVLRGSNHWLSFIWAGGQPWWDGSYQLATEPFLVLVTGLVAAFSLYGLFHRTMPWRLPFVLGALGAAVLLTLGHLYTGGSPLGVTFRELLDGALSPFRNIHKLDPVMRLPMALGFAHAVGLVGAWVGERAARRGLDSTGRVSNLAAVGVLCLLLLVSGRPLFTGDLRKPGWDEMPDAWTQAAAFLEHNAKQRRTLVLPGTGFGQQTWGWTIDEPLQSLAGSPWVSRSQVPLAPGGTIRYLDAIHERIEDGVGSPILADALARAGISHVVVRRDLDVWATESPSHARVDSAVQQSPGLKRVASFGRSEFGDQPMVDVYEVEREVPLLEAVAVSEVDTMAGGPEDVLTLMEAGLLDVDGVAVNASEENWSASPDVVGDGFRRRERNFGRVSDAVSQVMTADEEYRTARRAYDYAGVSEEDRVVARYASLSGISSSSSQGYADAFGAVRPEHGPFSAVDGEEDTYWSSSPWEDPSGQWLQLNFGTPESLTEMRLVAGVELRNGSPVRRVRIDVDDRAYERDVDPETGEVVLPLSGAPTQRVRVTVLDVFGDPRYGQVAIHEISLRGVDLERSLVLPDRGATGESAFAFRARPHRRACVDTGNGPLCDPGSARASEEEQGLNRVFTTTSAGTFTARGTVVARSTWAASSLLEPEEGLRATASSISSWDPSVGGQRAVDGDPTSAWIADEGDIAPRLELRWDEERTIDRITIEEAQVPGSLPTTAVIRSGDEVREVDLGESSVGEFEPLEASEVEITFPMQVADPSGKPLAPLTLGEVNLQGVEDLVVDWDPEAPVRTQCGAGPSMDLDDASRQTRVTGTVGDVVSGLPLTLEVCGDAEFDLGAGTHDLRVASTPEFATSSFVLAAETGPPPPPEGDDEVRGREVGIVDWGVTRRVVQVGSGPEAVLRIPENVNPGWRATLEGRELEPIRLDSWQQGYRVPEGAGGEVVLEYLPDTTYRVQLWVGGLLATLLYGIAVVLTLRRGQRRETVLPSPFPDTLVPGTTPVKLVALLVAYLLGGAPVALGLLGGLTLFGQEGRAGRLAFPAVVVAAGLQALSGIRGDGVQVLAADWVGGVAVGLLAATLIGSDRATHLTKGRRRAY